MPSVTTEVITQSRALKSRAITTFAPNTFLITLTARSLVRLLDDLLQFDFIASHVNGRHVKGLGDVNLVLVVASQLFEVVLDLSVCFELRHDKHELRNKSVFM